MTGLKSMMSPGFLMLFWLPAVAASAKEPRARTKSPKENRAQPSKEVGAPSRGPFIGSELGTPWSAHAVSIAQAQETYELEASFPSAGFMATLRAGYLIAPQRVLIALGGGLMYGRYTAHGAAYEKGEVSLTLTATYLVAFLRGGFAFTRRLSGLVGVDSYHPLAESITMESPTGSVNATPDAGFEIATHATSLTLRYALRPSISVDATVYIGSLVYSGLQGRGLNGLTAGVNYAL